MKHVGIVKPLILLSCVLFVFSIAACATTGGGFGAGVYAGEEAHTKGGPPPHAPAHGYRAKHTYHYYPDTSVYFDISRRVYFYLDGGNWRMSAALPNHLSVRLDDYVVIGMDSDRPYTESGKHKQKYPPGKMKEKKKGRKW